MNTLKDLYNKWGKQYLATQFAKRGMKRKPRYDLFSKYAREYLHDVLTNAIDKGEDEKTILGTLMPRAVRHPNFRNNRYGRNFEIIGGREYTIFDLMNKGNKYPVLTMRNNGLIHCRTVMWRCYIRPSVHWRHRMYKNFYDGDTEYKIMRYPNAEQAKRKRTRKIWRNNQLLNV